MLSTSCVRHLVIFLSIVVVSLLQMTPSATAAGIDPYLARYLRLTEPIALEVDEQGATREFSLEEISQGKVLFENNCLNCHVGGATLPDPQTSLALDKLKGANPPRDNVDNLVAFLRQPMIYNGSEETYWCRQVPESWMTQEEVESLAAFVLTAAQKARGWGTESF